MLRRVFCWPGRLDFEGKKSLRPGIQGTPARRGTASVIGARARSSSLLRFAGRGPWNRTEEDMSITRRTLVAAAAAVAFGATLPAVAAEKPSAIGLDYAYYNPVSLVLKNKGWVEEEFAKDGIDIRWVLSLGSNKALEYLSSSSVDFGSTAGAAALLSRINGNPIKSVYIYSKPEWTALVTRVDSPIQKVEDLKGKRIAATRGTDPYIFLLRVLDQHGLGEKDVKIVLLQHPDGKTALERGDVDAWAGL